jgi:2-keto-3-deoxy-6-phosphogluconate aldolase
MTDTSRTCFDRPAFTSRVVPVIVLQDAAQAVPLAHALLEGGVDVMEITLRHDSALAAIEAVARAVPQMHVGAGTVTRGGRCAAGDRCGRLLCAVTGLHRPRWCRPCGRRAYRSSRA